MPAALLLAFLIVRVAFVETYSKSAPARAAAIWPDHPEVVLESGLSQVGDTAAAGRPVDRALVDRLVSVSSRAPLAPEPFLVRGVDAQLAGDQSLALRSFLAARQRNPRAIAPRYFLADLYLKSGKSGPGLEEISALARLVPQSLPQVAPYLAAYAREPSAAPRVKAMLKTQPELERVLLNELAADAANAGLVFNLWSGRGGEEAKPWQARLMTNLVEAGRFSEARTAWARFTGISVEHGQLFDPEFATQAPPPFGWMLASGSSGVAERQEGGQLHALFYGREDLVLASQLLTLPPGRYRLAMDVKTASPESKSMSWSVRCLPSADPIGAAPLARPGPLAIDFSVPSGGCPAQRLELAGNAPEFPERAEATIGRLQLRRSTGR